MSLTRSDDPRQLLKDHGLQVTAQRLAVLRVVEIHPHATTDEVIELVRAEIGALSKQSAYDTLGVLTDHGVLRRIQPMGSAARYETRVGDNHHHLLCRGCGAVVDIDCAVGERPCLTAADDHGYEIDEHARGIITAAGYGDFIRHRTGHSLGSDVHYRGVNIDNLETQDRRRLIPGVMFTIEPGIYNPDAAWDDSPTPKGLGIRTEINCFVHADRVEVTTLPLQTGVLALL